MNITAVVALGILLVTARAAHADDIQTAYAAVTALLQKDGGGLVSLRSLCPTKNTDPWEYASSAVFVSIDGKDSAVLVNSGQCNLGNGHGQYLVLIQGGVAHAVTDAEIQDMSFLASGMYSDGDSLFLYGDRWLGNDPHCCPSKKATLEYNFKTHRHKFTIVGNNKS